MCTRILGIGVVIQWPNAYVEHAKDTWKGKKKNMFTCILIALWKRLSLNKQVQENFQAHHKKTTTTNACTYEIDS